MRRRDLLIGAAFLLGSANASGAIIGDGMVGVGSIPVILPSTTISDFAIKGSASAYIDLGTMAIPAGDWCIGVTAAPPTAQNVDYFLLSLGTQSDTILTDNGSLTIGFPGAVASTVTSYGYAAVGTDDAANPLAPRQVFCFASAQQFGISGPQQAAGANDGATRTIFVQKQGSTISLWIVDPNCCAIQHNAQTTSFGAIAAKAARLGCLGKASLSGFSAISYQRFFKTAQALTQYQMEAIAGGVDPRSVATFSAGSGDLLFAFNAAASDGQTYTDLIQGQTATAHGTFATATALLPASVDQNQIRFDIDEYRVFQSNGAATNIPFSGNAYGVDGTIQVALTDNNGTVKVSYTTIATTQNGKFAGILAGVTTQVADYQVKAKKLVSGSQVGSEYYASQSHFATGPVLEWLGQSLSEQMRTNGNFVVSSGPLQFNVRDYATPYDATMRDHYPVGGSKLTGPGYGEGQLTKIIGGALNCQFMQLNDALSGSSIDQWLSDTSGFNSTSPIGVLSNAIANIQRFRPKYVIWHQGENSLIGYSAYYAKLTQLYALFSAAISWPWYFLVIPLDNTFTSSVGYDAAYQAVRAAQIDWVTAVGSTDSKVIFACTVNDILKANTNSGDGIHKTATPGGYGIYSERVAQTILFLEGNVANSGLGPLIVSAHWNGDATVDVTLTQNGGTGLQTPNVGSVTGFEAALASSFASKLTISSVAITDATHVRITLSGTPASAPFIRYQWGCPGLGTTDAACGLSNALYDNRSPAINTTLGYPVVPTTTPIQAT